MDNSESPSAQASGCPSLRLRAELLQLELRPAAASEPEDRVRLRLRVTVAAAESVTGPARRLRTGSAAQRKASESLSHCRARSTVTSNFRVDLT